MNKGDEQKMTFDLIYLYASSLEYFILVSTSPLNLSREPN